MADNEQIGYMPLLDPKILRIAVALEHIATSASMNATTTAEAYAIGTRNDVPVQEGDPAYHNNSKWYSELAAQIVQDVEDVKDDAEAAALVVEGYTVGKQNGVDVASGSPYYQNNMLYFMRQAGASRDDAALSAAAALAAAQTASAAYDTDLLADVYDATASHMAGEYSIYNGGLYVAKQNIGPEAWDSTHWEAAQVGVVLAEMADAMKSLVTGVTLDEDGIRVKVTKKEGEPTYFSLPQGLDFDGGYCQESVDGNTYLYFTKNGEDISEIEPIQISGGLAFDGGFCQEDAQTGKYYLHLTKNNVELDSSVFTPIEIVGGGGGGGGSSAIQLSNVQRPTSVRNGQDAIFSFVATSPDSSAITVMWYVDGVLKQTREGNSGDTFTFNAGGMLRNSNTSVVRASITSASGATATPSWTVTSSEFSLSWGSAINPVTLYTEDENVFVVVHVAAQGGTTNQVTITIGENSVTRAVRGTSDLTVEINKGWFEPGVNTVVASMVSGADQTVQADPIHYTAIWGYGVSSPVVAFENETQTGIQYDNITIRYLAYTPGSETSVCLLRVGSDEARTITVNREMQQFIFAPQQEGSYTISLTCGTAADSMTLVITSNPYNISIVTGDNLRYNLDPVGHSNADADRDQFGNLVFSAGFDWVNGGFHTDVDGAPAFVVKKGSTATLPRSLFADGDVNGKTIDISFRIVNSDQYDAVAVRDLDNGETHGLILRANEGEVRMGNASGQIFRYCEENRIDFSVRVENAVSQRLSTIWLDGIPSKADKYATGMLNQSENATVIGSEHCDIWIYAIRVYNTMLSDLDMLQNYIASGSTYTEKVSRSVINDIFDDNDRITPESLHRAAPDLTIIELECDRMTVSKSDSVPALIRITDGATKLEFPKATGVDSKGKGVAGSVFKVQGTSSAAYGRSSYNMDIDFSKCPSYTQNGTSVSGKPTYKISNMSIPVSYMNIKVNVASSENANNVCAVDWYNAHQPFLKEARSRTGVRDVVEAKPCAVFIRNTGAPQWFSSQYLETDDVVLYAMGDLCNSKKNDEVFGQDMSGDHPTLACVEVSGNDTLPQRFRAKTGFEYNDDEEGWVTFDGYDDQGKPKYITHYEWRMEPDSDHKASVIAAWEAMVDWVVGTIGDSAAFAERAAEFFTMDSLLYHFLMIEHLAAYDNVSKNTFYSYDWDPSADQSIADGYRWNIVEAYDWDTILGADNDGKPYGDYGLDFGDQTDGGRDYFNADDNPIWQNIQAAYQGELSSLYISLRGTGTWDTSALVTKWDEYQARRPHAAMIQDAYVKYVLPYKTTNVIIDGKSQAADDSYLVRMQGSKTYWRRQFLTYQMDYMDGKYGYYNKNGTLQFRTNGESGTKTFYIKTYAKTYVTVIVDDNKVASVKVNAGTEKAFSGVSVGNNATLYFSPDRLIQYIRPLNETHNSTFVNPGASKLMEAVLGGETENTSWDNATALNVPSPILKELSIRNMRNYAQDLNLAGNAELESVDTRGTNAGLITLAPYAPLKTILLNACTGIVLRNLNHVTTFSLTSGAGLTHIWMENCNSLVGDTVFGYITQMMNAGGTSTRRMRLIGVNWTLENTTLLNWLLTCGSLTDSGENGNPPCVITGRIYIPILRSTELEAYERAWPEVVQYSQVITTYTVTFLNYDDTPVLDLDGKPYVQYVDSGSAAYDPVNAGEAVAPARASDERYIYTYDGWDDLPRGVIQNETVRAVYATADVSYTVQFWNGIGASHGSAIGDPITTSYGQKVALPENPTYTAMEGSNIFYVFNGWDRSTAFICPDQSNPSDPYTINVHARWIMGNLPSLSSNPGLNAMNWAQRHAVVKREDGSPSDYWNLGETMDVTLGHGEDYLFENVESDLLIGEPTYFDGTAPMIFNGRNGLPLLQLFNGSIDRFTLAIDYETTGDSGALVACFTDSGNEGFQLRRTGNFNNMVWGDQNLNVGYKYQRGMLVIRYNRGLYPLVLYMTHDGNTIVDEYPINMDDANGSHIGNDAQARSITTQTDAPLTFGGVGFLNGTDISGMRATGWIHWARIWYDDLGVDCAKSMAAMPHVATRFAYTGIKYRDGLESADTISADFSDEGCLPLRGRMNWTNTNAGGWDSSMMRKFLNGQYFAGLPIPLQEMIVEARVRATAGGGSSGTPSRNILNSMDKIYLSAYAELFASVTGNNADNTAYVDELDDERHRMPGFDYKSAKGQTADNQTRIRWPGYTLPADANFIVSSSDPTTPGLGLTVHSGKTVWIHTGYSSNGYLYIDGDTANKHKWYAGRSLLDTNTNNIKSAAGADSDGGTNGKWILASYWWSRSPNVTSSTYFWNVYTSGGSTNNYAYYAFGLAPRFSI